MSLNTLTLLERAGVRWYIHERKDRTTSDSSTTSTGTPSSPVRAKDYNLICVLEASLKNAYQLVQYIDDAKAAGDDELAEWFSKIQHNSLKAGEQGKQMLAARLTK